MVKNINMPSANKPLKKLIDNMNGLVESAKQTMAENPNWFLDLSKDQQLELDGDVASLEQYLNILRNYINEEKKRRQTIPVVQNRIIPKVVRIMDKNFESYNETVGVIMDGEPLDVKKTVHIETCIEFHLSRNNRVVTSDLALWISVKTTDNPTGRIMWLRGLELCEVPGVNPEA